ncbi:SCO family protein [Neptunitalea lumnitzerae]|uniref:SCO family protein n=1 Tax=Neptunitalea lumnitzerae TaxID=2965509 RepID=A0ABQ5MGH6_9FLAO|nr:SCO family protein [Neptunitalea sp. Y10]GLB48483.1 SCO family protein [Neptunitalea sp. Y10]
MTLKAKKSTSLIALISFLSILLVITFLAIYYFLSKPGREAAERLPIFQPTDVNEKLVDSTVQYIKKYHTIANFKLVNQNGDTITQKNYDGKIYVADFFFTTCPGICPIMTANMADIQKEILNNNHVMLLSHSVTPVQDSVPQLKKYAIEKGVNDSKWNLVTGDKKQIYALARKSYLAAESDGDGGPYDMVHTENFVLVDTKKRIRGFYDGTKKEDIQKLLIDIKKLEKEEFE